MRKLQESTWQAGVTSSSLLYRLGELTVQQSRSYCTLLEHKA
jgi:hypothetical protein